jgi:hypothetical protein
MVFVAFVFSVVLVLLPEHDDVYGSSLVVVPG